MFLRPLDIDRDAEALHGVYSDENTCTYLLDPATANLDETRALLRKYDDGPTGTSWVFSQTDGGPALGRVKMVPKDPSVFEAVIMVRPDAQGRGLGPKAVAAACDIVFEDHAARRIFADIDPDNTPSLKLFARLGFQREGVLRAMWETHIGVRDTVMMSLIASDPRPWRVTPNVF